MTPHPLLAGQCQGPSLETDAQRHLPVSVLGVSFSMGKDFKGMHP